MKCSVNGVISMKNSNQYEKHLSGAITKQEYDSWRYNYTGGEK